MLYIIFPGGASIVDAEGECRILFSRTHENAFLDACYLVYNSIGGYTYSLILMDMLKFSVNLSLTNTVTF